MRSMRYIEEALQQRWSLRLRSGSREIVAPRPTDQDMPETDLEPRRTLRVLGHVLPDDASCSPEWRSAEKQVRAAFSEVVEGRSVASLRSRTEFGCCEARPFPPLAFVAVGGALRRPSCRALIAGNAACWGR